MSPTCDFYLFIHFCIVYVVHLHIIKLGYGLFIFRLVRDSHGKFPESPNWYVGMRPDCRMNTEQVRICYFKYELELIKGITESRTIDKAD